ncbi:MAG: hypothetical protein ACFNKE_03740, partial [Neisseria elongata]
ESLREMVSSMLVPGLPRIFFTASLTLMPRVSDGPTNSAAPKLEVKLRNQPKAPLKTAPAGPAPIRTAAPIYNAALSKPKLSRNQILQKEIDNERAALARTRGQLELTRQKGGDIGALKQAVADREANIRAIEREMKR